MGLCGIGGYFPLRFQGLIYLRFCFANPWDLGDLHSVVFTKERLIQPTVNWERLSTWGIYRNTTKSFNPLKMRNMHMLSDMSLPSSVTWYPSIATWYPSIATWYPCQDFYMQLQYMHTIAIQLIFCAEGLVGWWEVVPETCRQEWRHYTSECLPNLSFV